MRLVFIPFIFLWCIVSVVAQEAPVKTAKQPWLYVGAYADYNNNMFDPNFSSFPNVFSCNSAFTTGTGSGVAFGLLAEYPLLQYLSIETRVGYTGLSGRLNRIEQIGNTAPIGGLPKATDKVESQFELFANLHAISIEPDVNIMLFGKVRATVGLRAAFLMTSTFEQKETLVAPDYAYFVADSSRIRNRVTGDIPNAQKFQMAAVIGAGLDVPVSSRATLTPEIRYHLALTDLSDVRWSISTLQFGAAFRYALYKAPPPVIIRDTVYQRDTLTVSRISISEERVILRDSSTSYDQSSSFDGDQEFIRKSVSISEHYAHEKPKLAELNLKVQAFGIDKDGNRSNISSFIVEETELEENYPLLPQVFFAEGSAELSQSRLHALTPAQTSSFSEFGLSHNTLNVYHDVLNIVASRMNRIPSAKLTLIGCNSGVNAEKNNHDLSEKRANAVRDYFIQVWNIDPSRIIVKAQNLPASPSNQTSVEGQEENRRVEMVASDFEILKPVSIKDITVKANPPTVELIPTVTSEAGVKNWKARLMQESQTLRSMSGEGSPEKYTWKVTDDPYPKLDKPVNVKYSVTDNSGQTIDAESKLSVQQLTIRQKRFEQKDDKRIDRFSLIVFDFNKADLNADNKKIVQEVKSRIQSNSTITIAGYADKSGESEYNRELARRRCVEVQKSVELNDQNSIIQPIGSDTLLYDNATPEGRAYCRTVQIVIETPVK